MAIAPEPPGVTGRERVPRERHELAGRDVEHDQVVAPAELGEMQISVWKTTYSDDEPSARPERIATHRGEAR